MKLGVLLMVKQELHSGGDGHFSFPNSISKSNLKIENYLVTTLNNHKLANKPYKQGSRIHFF